jgi:tripartite-type tricarboxylate transporter receptor subunit TctC
MPKKSEKGLFFHACLLLAAVFFLFFGAQGLQAQDFPTKPINLYIPFGAGGSSDLTARVMTNIQENYFGQPLVVHLKPGGGGAIASEFVAQAKPDGYTLLFGHTNCNSILPAVEGRSRGPGEYTPVCRISTVYGFMVAKPDAPFKTFKEMVAWAKAHPGELSFGNTGAWSVTDFMWKQIEQKLGFKSRIVTYTGGGKALVGVLGGHVMVSHGAPTQLLPHLRAGKLRALAHSGPARHPDMPDVPSAEEAGYGFAAFGSWKGILAPKGTPKPVVDKLALAFKKITENKQAIANLRKLGDEFGYMTGEEFEKFWRADFEKYKELSKAFKK